LDSNYFVTNSRELKLELFEAFKKCILDLTLNESEKDKIKIEKLEEKLELHITREMEKMEKQMELQSLFYSLI